MNSPANTISSPARARFRRLFSLAVAAATPLFVGGISASSAAADPPDSGRSAMQRLSDEFDLVPQMLSAGRGHSEGDPLRMISRRMNVIHGDLGQFETDKPVQTRERQVVQSLDEIIAALERHCNGLGRGHTPGTGRKASIIVKGDPAFGDLHGVNANARQWALLPPKLRKEILQSKTDGFPPGYEALLQSYYQQLAEEKSIDEKPAASPATEPAMVRATEPATSATPAAPASGSKAISP